MVVKIDGLNSFAHGLQETPVLQLPFNIVVQGWRPAVVLKRDSSTGAFL